MGPWPFRACSSQAPSLVLEIALVLQFGSSFLRTSRAKVQHTSERRAVTRSPSPELQVGGSASDADQATPSPALRRSLGSPSCATLPFLTPPPTPGHGKGADTKFSQLGLLSLCWTTRALCMAQGHWSSFEGFDLHVPRTELAENLQIHGGL